MLWSFLMRGEGRAHQMNYRVFDELAIAKELRHIY
jgi:hypothetical protein